MKQRILYLDVIRIIACMMIIVMHAPIPNTGLNGLLLSTDSLLTSPGIGLFIMVSGALLLPVNIPTKLFIKRRFSKIIGPTVFWTIFYFLVAPYTDTVNRGAGIESFLSIPFTPQFNGVLWFMYMLAGLYLIAPVLSGWLKQASQREVFFYLCLWGITLCYPIIRSYIMVNESNTGILYYLGGYAGYFLLGYYLNSYVSRFSKWVCWLFIFFPICIAVIIKLMQVEIDFYDLFGYLSIFIVLMSVSLFLLVKNLKVEYDDKSKSDRIIVMISNCCFGIYLVHIFVMRSILWKCAFIHNMTGITQIIVVSLLTFIGSFVITRLIGFIPCSEYIIGFKQRR